mmetsp:Transcript_13611/g.15789  ORF Transcript_13611/g.15789 Transcript_13611/m.15789 type:complete len:102 (-) Transcript_13611:34-339(-)|eukprot:CAMPEP_0168336972 /NCGR_PEP_ID=MMETSP0213-20121227/11879_1 /TAXON_ID=151035 /ORGANISM="Euplotes harpa, Strain FSP1.4" /LENGTH=101 /DNA_ID=CAMNT_0008342305 /DNA_START=19 /DNA_END=324 /DNA_ORIENTATION=-
MEKQKKTKEKGAKRDHFKIRGQGLNDEILEKLGQYDDLKKFIKLHKSIQNVKKAISQRHDAIRGLKEQFREVGKEIKAFSQEQNKQTSSSTKEDKIEPMIQ